MFCPEIAGPDVMDVVTERSAWIVTTLCTTTLSNSIQFLRGSHQQDMDGWPDYWPGLPPMWYATHCVSPCLAILSKSSSPAHADKSCKYAALLLRGKCFG